MAKRADFPTGNQRKWQPSALRVADISDAGELGVVESHQARSMATLKQSRENRILYIVTSLTYADINFYTKPHLSFSLSLSLLCIYISVHLANLLVFKVCWAAAGVEKCHLSFVVPATFVLQKWWSEKRNFSRISCHIGVGPKSLELYLHLSTIYLLYR